ncbi:MAG: Nramp family divalent metal transporter [Psychroflexus maritimus]
MKNYFKIGPGAFVAAAFIGPGTITVCSLAGVRFGYELLWALVFSILATVILQGMSARFGIVSRKDLVEAFPVILPNKALLYLATLFVILAIVIGNSAYEAGNIGGASLGFSLIVDSIYVDFFGFSINYIALLIGLLSYLVLSTSNYKKIEKILVILVALMSLSFLTTALITKPDLNQLFGGFVPSLSTENLLSVMAIVGTTIVPYNLFLHAAVVQEKWKNASAMKECQQDTMLAIGLGGLVSMSVLITAAAIPQSEMKNIVDLAETLVPLYGSLAKYLLAFGFFAAGITSTITAAMAAAYVLKSSFKALGHTHKKAYAITWKIVILIGVIFASFSLKPIHLIELAQVSNAILLPFIAIFLLWIVNSTKIMGIYKNSKLQNIAGIIVVFLCFLLSASLIYKLI